jgi:hypothetical protein
MTDQFNIEYIDGGRPPRNAPDPKYPDGVHVDHGDRPACRVELPYMTKNNIGKWLVTCTRCKCTMLITMASRPDDPRSVMMPCKLQ